MVNDFDSKNWHWVLSVKVPGVDIDWGSAHDCSIESRSLKHNASKKASQLEEYLRISGLLKDFSVRFRFADSDALLEVFVNNSNHEMFDFEKKLEPIRNELRRRLVWSRDSLMQENSTLENIIQPPDTKPVSYAEFEALKKLLKGSSGSKMEVNFLGAGKEDIDMKETPHVEPNLLDENVIEQITAEIVYFDDQVQKVKFFNIQDMSGYILGLLVLEVIELTHREILLQAQTNFCPVTVKYNPSRNPIRPDKHAREGRLIEIVSVGEPKGKMLL